MEISDLEEKQSLAGDSPAKSFISSSTETVTIAEFSTFIEKLSPILDEMKDSNEVADLPAIQKAIESLETDLRNAKSVVGSPNIRSSPAKNIEYLTQNLGRSLGLVLFASHDVPIANKEKIKALHKEMMNVRFDFSSERGSEFPSEAEEETMEEEIEEEKVENEIEDEEDEETEEDDKITLDIDDIMMQIKNGNDGKFKNALFELNALIMDGVVSNERINDDGMIKVLSQKLGSSKGHDRVTIIQILRYLIMQNNQNKEEMKDLGFLSTLVKSLARDVDERREAVGLLLNLADDPAVRRRIGKVQGCIVMLVTISNGDDQEASRDARKLLNAMSSNTQHALHMAEAGYFKPLVHYLKEGSDMSKVLMATAISRMELTDQNKASLGEDGAIEPLVNMFNKGNLEAKLSALNALKSLSSLKENIQLLIHSGIVVALLQLLFSVTSVLMTLREPASAILAKISQSESILVKQDIAQQMLSLLNLSSPVIQNHLLEALNNIASHSSASKVRKKMKENGAIQLLLPFITERNTKIRTGTLNLVYTLSKDIPGEFREQLGETYLTNIVDIVSTSTCECEKAASLGILSNLPVDDRKITDLLKNANLFPVLISMVNSISSTSTPTTIWLTESIAGILIRFTIPTDKKLQHYSAENGIIPVLLKLLSSGSSVTKSKAATCLTQLSQNSLHLSKSRKSKWFCIPHTESVCEVHDGYCSIKSTFCLVKTGAVSPLIQALEGSERASNEAVLSCLLTLLQDEIWEKGINYISKMSGIQPILRVVESGNSKSQEKALWILEKFFRVEAHRVEYGQSAQMLLIDLAQNGDPILKPTLGKLLAQLEILQAQSSYF
ncbi:U-box domain-containing 44-like [Olea europaea subsp. europaea]|uniref:U-box domain-containing 44-like n=1 Tax=Olea europaea subsp. europaea TaxID=158383 RepID=A0A8S0UQM9_OLEEU|nr:U-box domain-containing 44-like [Olea europaea subsp. europaea]